MIRFEKIKLVTNPEAKYSEVYIERGGHVFRRGHGIPPEVKLAKPKRKRKTKKR